MHFEESINEYQNIIEYQYNTLYLLCFSMQKQLDSFCSIREILQRYDRLWWMDINILILYIINSSCMHLVEGSLEVKLPTIWTDEKQSREEAERRERLEERRVEEKRRKKMQMREKVGKSRNTVFLMIWGSGGSKSRLAKAAGAEPAGQMRDEKLHAVLARSTFPSQNVQNTSVSDDFWKLRCRKSARRCGAKHISKSKCT